MTLTRMRIQESDSDSDLIIPKKKAKDQVRDLKKIIKLNSSARKKRQNYDNLSLKLVNSVNSTVKLEQQVKKVVLIPEWIKQDQCKYFKTNIVLVMLKTGKFKRNLDNFKWLMDVLIKDVAWKKEVVKVLVEFLLGYSKEKRWEMIADYLSFGKVVLELVQEMDKKGDFEMFKEFVLLSRDDELFKNGFVEFACIFQELIKDLDQVIS